MHVFTVLLITKYCAKIKPTCFRSNDRTPMGPAVAEELKLRQITVEFQRGMCIKSLKIINWSMSDTFCGY